jgi:hypothetical protein
MSLTPPVVNEYFGKNYGDGIDLSGRLRWTFFISHSPGTGGRVLGDDELIMGRCQQWLEANAYEK